MEFKNHQGRSQEISHLAFDKAQNHHSLFWPYLVDVINCVQKYTGTDGVGCEEVSWFECHFHSSDQTGKEMFLPSIAFLQS